MIKAKYYFTIGPVIYTGLNIFFTVINIDWNKINIPITTIYFITHIITTLTISEIFLSYLLILFIKPNIQFKSFYKTRY